MCTYSFFNHIIIYPQKLVILCYTSLSPLVNKLSMLLTLNELLILFEILFSSWSATLLGQLYKRINLWFHSQCLAQTWCLINASAPTPLR